MDEWNSAAFECEGSILLFSLFFFICFCWRAEISRLFIAVWIKLCQNYLIWRYYQLCSNLFSSLAIPGGSQDEWCRDGAQDEQAPLQQELHAQGTPTHEKTEARKYSQASIRLLERCFCHEKKKYDRFNKNVVVVVPTYNAKSYFWRVEKLIAYWTQSLEQ